MKNFSIQYPFAVMCFCVMAAAFCSCHSAVKPKEEAAAEKQVQKKDTFILPAPGKLQDKEKQRIYEACRQWFDSSLATTVFNGGVLVAQKGNIIFEKYRGNLHLNGTDEIKASTPFHIASVTKTFTAMAVLKLWQDGKLQLDDELNKYFPAFNYPGVTVRCLLNHRSGLPNYVYFLERMGWNQARPVSNRDVLDFLISNRSAMADISAACSHFSYCNTNYALLALLIEKVSGSSYPQFMQQQFFEPLHMNDTYVLSIADSSKATPSYDWRGDEIPMNYLDFVYGDKNIYSTPRDLLKWDRLLSSGVLFKPETLEQAYAPYSNEKPGIRNYGLGWRMNIYDNGKKLIFHNGWWHGNNSAFTRLIDEDVTLIAVNNRFTRATYHINQLSNIFSNYFVPAEEDTDASVKDSSKKTSADSSSALKDSASAVKISPLKPARKRRA
ncbi:MAG: serine hydrolase domain-containing protein [Ferruginibacter sp.]